MDIRQSCLCKSRSAGSPIFKPMRNLPWRVFVNWRPHPTHPSCPDSQFLRRPTNQVDQRAASLFVWAWAEFRSMWMPLCERGVSLMPCHGRYFIRHHLLACNAKRTTLKISGSISGLPCSAHPWCLQAHSVDCRLCTGWLRCLKVTGGPSRGCSGFACLVGVPVPGGCHTGTSLNFCSQRRNYTLSRWFPGALAFLNSLQDLSREACVRWTKAPKDSKGSREIWEMKVLCHHLDKAAFETSLTRSLALAQLSDCRLVGLKLPFLRHLADAILDVTGSCRSLTNVHASSSVTRSCAGDHFSFVYYSFKQCWQAKICLCGVEQLRCGA